MIRDLLCEGVRTLLGDAAGALPVRGLGVVRRDGPEHVIFTYVDPFGATGYRPMLHEIPEEFRPTAAGLLRLPASALEGNPLGLVESRVLHTGLPENLRQESSVREVITLPVPETDGDVRLVVGVAEPAAMADGQLSTLHALASRVVSFLQPPESTTSELELLRRLEAVEKLLPALFRVLDVREIFDRLSAIAKDVLRHDFASLGILSDDLLRMDLYVQTAPSSYPQGGPMPFPRAQTASWLYRFVDDLTSNPLERNLESAKVGGRSSLRVAIRLEDQILGALNFTSRDPAPYTAVDLVIARRIADYVALALSHQRLAEQARSTEELRARAANLELLDELLAALTDTGDLPEVFDRISAIARKVLPHDAVVLPVILPDGRQARVYASSGVPAGAIPEIVNVPEAMVENPDWESEITDDVTMRTEPQHVMAARLGFKSSIRVPIRLDGRFCGSLIFSSIRPAAYKQPDILVARRIADRLALTLSRERGIEAMRRADAASAHASKLESRVRALTEELDARTGYRRVVGESAQWHTVLTQATQVAATETTVLLLGESGTGKEVVARFIHRASPRRSGPFIALNCAALPEQLLEAELFGYERGAYTGAIQSKPGQLEQAGGGMLFLDEVGEMSLSAQAKFLRVLQEREFQRLGGTRVLRTDARIVAATNRDLQRAIGQGQFREDLFYRLNVFAIQLPPLRERRDDILPLSQAFLNEIGRGIGRPPAGISRDARKLLIEYHWPGNVRELRNILERAAILCEGGLITAEHLAVKASALPVSQPAVSTKPPEPLSSPALPVPGLPSSVGDLSSMERAMIEQALQNARFNKSKAARALGLTRQQLYVRMRRYSLE